jgi:hypothetical protein
MQSKKILVNLAILLLVALAFPAAQASDVGLARTSEGGCVLVHWTEDPYVITNAVGCAPTDPCVDVNWTTTPPQVGIGEC